MMTTFHAYVLVLISICRPAKANTALLLANIGIGTADVETTLHLEKSFGTQFHENDPIKRPFLELPKPAVISLSIAGDVVVAEIGYRIRRSERWYRHLWWAPQLALAGVNAWCARSNIRLSRQ